MSVRVLIEDHPHRTLALATGEHALIFRHTHTAEYGNNSSSSSLAQPNSNRPSAPPRCMVEFALRSSLDLSGYRLVNLAQGTLGLITLNNDVFLCAVTGATQVATVRPGETVQKIHSVEFCESFWEAAAVVTDCALDCLNRSDYDQIQGQEPNPYPGQTFSSDDVDSSGGLDHGDSIAEHPFHALKKLLNGGHFYYSADFDLTSRLQERY